MGLYSLVKLLCGNLFFPSLPEKQNNHDEGQISEALLAYARKTLPEIFMELETDERGLIDSEADERLADVSTKLPDMKGLHPGMRFYSRAISILLIFCFQSLD